MNYDLYCITDVIIIQFRIFKYTFISKMKVCFKLVEFLLCISFLCLEPIPMKSNTHKDCDRASINAGNSAEHSFKFQRFVSMSVRSNSASHS